MREGPPPQPQGKVASFVWVRSNGQTWPQKWFYPIRGFELGGSLSQWTDAYVLDETLAAMPLDTLATLFPMPAQEGPGSRFVIPPVLPAPEPEEPTHEARIEPS